MHAIRFKVGDHVVRSDWHHRHADEIGEIISLEDNSRTMIGPRGTRYNYWVVRWPSQGRSPLRYRVDKAHELLRHAESTLVHATRKKALPRSGTSTPAQLQREIDESIEAARRSGGLGSFYGRSTYRRSLGLPRGNAHSTRARGRRSHSTISGQSPRVRGFRDVSTPTQQRFVTEQGDVEIREVEPRGGDWDVLPLGGATRRVRGRGAAVTEARALAKKSPEWRRGDWSGEDSAREVTGKYGRSFGERGLEELRANLRREARTGEAQDFDRGYVVGYARGVVARRRG